MWSTLLEAHRRHGAVIDPVAVVLLAGALRLGGLGHHGLRTDEIYIALRSAGPLAEVAGRVRETVMGAPVEFFLRHAVLRFSNDEYFLRLPDALAGTLSVYVLYRLATRLFDRTTAFVASVLFAVSGLHIYHSQNARYYALYCLLSLVSTAILLRAKESGRGRDWTAYVLSMILGFYNCYFTAFVGLVHALFVLGPSLLPARQQKRPVRMGFVLSGAAIVAGVAPWLLVYSPVSNIPYPPPDFILAVRMVTSGFAGTWGWTEGFYCGLLAVGLVLTRRQDLSSVILCVLFVAVPIPIIWWLDRHFSYFFAARQMIFALPFFLLLAAHGAVRGAAEMGVSFDRPTWLPRAILAAVMLVCVAESVRELRSDRLRWVQEEWRESARYLLDRLQPGEVLLMPHLPLGPPDGDNAGYYLRAFGPDPLPFRIIDASTMDAALLPAMLQKGRVWMLVSSESRAALRPELNTAIERGFAKEAAFHGGFLYHQIEIFRSR